MAELTSQERLQPSLLDRLTDDEPENPQESPDKRQLSLNQLKASVLRDLTWLLNATALFSGADNLVANNPAASSVLNYGLPALAGRSASSVEIKAIEKLITDAIVTYEPRILRDTLRVTARVAPGQMNHNALSFRIEGDLWAQPLPLRLLLQTDLDLETGHVQVIHGDTRRTA